MIAECLPLEEKWQASAICQITILIRVSRTSKQQIIEQPWFVGLGIIVFLTTLILHLK